MYRISFVFIIAIVPVIAELPDLEYADFDSTDMKPSSAVPINVNRVRPGDIKVIGALGDSLTAGSGAGAISWVPWLNYRGMNFAIGGQLELEHHVTIPNILKKFNPNLFGQSLGIGPVDDWNAAQLNVAIGGQKAEDLLAQAKDLVEKMKMHGMHIGNDWKLITIFIGTNDAKEFCKDKEPLYNPANYSINIRRALRFLQINLPRTIVNLIAMQNEQIWTKTQAHEACKPPQVNQHSWIKTGLDTKL